MDIEMQQKGDGHLFVLSGELNRSACDGFRTSILSSVKKAGADIYLDMRNLHFIDSAGLGTLVSLKASIEKSGHRVLLVSPSADIRTSLVAFRFDKVFDIIEDPPCK